MKFALFHKLHGDQPLTHRSARRIDTGWYSLELASWVLEVEVSERTERITQGLLARVPSLLVPLRRK